MAGRQGPTGKQRPSPGGQRPSPTRVPTRTSRRVGIGQGDLPHTKVETSVSRMHGYHKEQNGSHSLSRWKERLALQHRHAGMSTGSESCTLRGILSKGPQALMTRLGPSHERGPGTQLHKIVSEFSVHMLHSINVMTMYSTEFPVRICYIQCAKCSYQQGSGPMIFVYIMWPHWRRLNVMTQHRKENLPLLWYLGKLKFMEEIKCFVNNFLYPYPYPETSLTLGMPRDIPYCPIHCIPFKSIP